MLTPWNVVLHENPTSQEFPRLLWNRKVPYRVNRNLPPVPTLIQMIMYLDFSNIHFSIFPFAPPSLPNHLFPLGFPTKILYVFLISHMRAIIPIDLFDNSKNA